MIVASHQGGNRDQFTSAFIACLASDSRLSPFTPVTAKNYRSFAKLLAIGWRDLHLGVRGKNKPVRKRGYHSNQEWLADRIRAQFGFRANHSRKQNPN